MKHKIRIDTEYLTIRCEGLEESIQCFKETLRDAEADAVIKLKDYLQIK